MCTCITQGPNNQDLQLLTQTELESYRPGHCTFTNEIPDLTVFMQELNKLIITELSVPYEPNISRMQLYKANKYPPLVADIESNMAIQ